MVFCCGILFLPTMLIFQDIIKTNIWLHNIFIALFSLSGFSIIIAGFGPYFETEPLNGKLIDEIIINENEIIIFKKIIPLSNIKEIELKLNSFYGKHTDNRRFGPAFYQGVNNYFSIKIEREITKIFFLISNQKQFNDLEKIIFNIITEEKIKFKFRYLDYISDGLKKTDDYKIFIDKLNKEKRLLVK